MPFAAEGRCFRLGQCSELTTDIVIALHGHGQLAPFFLRKFAILQNDTRCIYAPEGLSRYYLHGHQGRVGATWMTREDRERDIRNYCTYLDACFEKERSSWPASAHVHILGFSQGAATATRWVLQGNIRPHRLILWSGILPYDMDVSRGRSQLKDVEAISVFGTKDPFLSDEKQQEMTDLAGRTGIEFRQIVFDGGHVIPQEVLAGLFD